MTLRDLQPKGDVKGGQFSQEISLCPQSKSEVLGVNYKKIGFIVASVLAFVVGVIGSILALSALSP